MYLAPFYRNQMEAILLTRQKQDSFNFDAK